MEASRRSFALGCSDFQFKTTDETVICARNMDFPIEMESVIQFYNREEKFSGGAPDRSLGLQWTSKLGFIGVNAFGMKNVIDMTAKV